MPELDQEKRLRLIACPTLGLMRGRVDRYVYPGMTVAQHLREIGWTPNIISHARVTIDDRLIDYADWEYAVPQAGQCFVTRVIPMGGGAGGGKDAFRIVAMLGIIALSLAAPALIGTFGGLAGALLVTTPGMAALTTAAVSIVGTLLITALIPPARPRLNDLSSDNLSPTLSLTGSSNQFAPYAPIPRVYGRHRIYPPLASRTFTEVVGADQYLRALFCFGYGPLDLEDFRIGQTPLDQFEGVELELRYGYPEDAPLTLFPNDVFEDALSILLTATFDTRNSQPDAAELSIDVTFPAGVGQQHPRFGFIAHQVNIFVEYRKVGDSTWLLLADLAKPATLTTTFLGTNNDLLFTARAVGAVGNAIHLQLIPTINPHLPPGTNVTVATLGIPASVKAAPTLVINYRPGVATAAQLKAAIEANALANGAVTVAFAPGNTGAGTIPQKIPVFPDRNSTWFFQLAGGADFVPAFTAQGPTQKQLRLSRRFPVPEVGEYEVRVRKTTDPETDPDVTFYLSTAYWTVLRTIQANPPVLKRGVCWAALRIKATGQLNGTIDQLNAIATSLLLDWDRDTASWVTRATANPASIYRDVLQGSANRRPKTDDQLDLPQLEAFHEHCTDEAFTFNAVIDFQTTVKQLRQDVLATGRGCFHLRDMLYSVLFETVQPIGVAPITPRNSSAFKWNKRFVDLPHALRIRYVDEQSDYRQNERIVYADGFTKETASIFQDADAGLGVTNATQVWTLKKRELAEAVLRADEYSVTMDFEHLKFTRGDRVELQHDALLFALQSARVLEGQVDGTGLLIELTLDQEVVMEAGIDYGVRIWKAGGGSCVGKCVTAAGTQTILTFATPIPESIGVAIGDLLTFGLVGQESVPCVVKSIRPGADYAATITLVDYAPGIMTADTVPIDPYEGQITYPQVDQNLIAPPIVDRVQSDEAVLVRALDGALESRILITVTFLSGFRIPVDRLEAQFRRSDSEAPWLQLGAAVDGTTAEIGLMPVEDGVTYDFRLRAVDTRTGTVSHWNATQGHTVIGKTSLPPDVEVLVIEQDRLRWNYPNPPRDHAGFLVRYRAGGSRDWESATSAHDGILLTTDFTIFRGLGLTTWLVKAIDVANNESAAPASVTVDFGDLLLDNIVFTTDHRALGWPGTITQGSVVASQLIADASAPYWTTDGAPFWSGFDGDLFWDASYLEMTYDFSLTPPLELLDATLKLALEAFGEWTIQYRTDSSALMWSDDDSVLMWGSDVDLMWAAKGPYTQWPGTLAPLSHQQYDLRIVTKAGLMIGILDQLQVILDVPDLIEVLNDVVVSPGGSRLPLTKLFRAIAAVRVDLQDDGGDAAYVKVIDKDLVLHPLVRAFNSSDATTTALVDAVVQGY